MYDCPIDPISLNKTMEPKPNMNQTSEPKTVAAPSPVAELTIRRVRNGWVIYTHDKLDELGLAVKSLLSLGRLQSNKERVAESLTRDALKSAVRCQGCNCFYCCCVLSGGKPFV
jgi:hypothetical protein